MEIRNKRVAVWYAVVIVGVALLYVWCVYEALNAPDTGRYYYMQDGE